MPPKNAIQNLSGSTTSIDPFIAAATTAPQGFSAEERFEALLSELAYGYLNEDELALLKRAFAFASEAHGNQKRKSGEPFVIHPVEVAIILADLRMDVEVLCAALLHDTVEDTAATKGTGRRRVLAADRRARGWHHENLEDRGRRLER